jgi:hypothetical protein
VSDASYVSIGFGDGGLLGLLSLLGRRQFKIQNSKLEKRTTADDFIKNKPVNATTSTAGFMSAADKTKLDGVASGAEVNVQSDWNQSTATADDFIKNKPANLVSDASYVHTDNNYTTAEKTKLSGIAPGAEVNVQSDWNQSTTTSDDFIKNKPVNATTSTAGFMSAADKTKLDGVASGAGVNVQSDWNQTTTTADDYIKNKPSIPAAANNAKLIINQSGTKKGEFTANASTDVTIDLANDNTTYSNATTSTAGLMSAADKTKLNGMATIWTGTQAQYDAISSKVSSFRTFRAFKAFRPQAIQNSKFKIQNSKLSTIYLEGIRCGRSSHTIYLVKLRWKCQECLLGRLRVQVRSMQQVRQQYVQTIIVCRRRLQWCRLQVILRNFK